MCDDDASTKRMFQANISQAMSGILEQQASILMESAKPDEKRASELVCQASKGQGEFNESPALLS